MIVHLFYPLAVWKETWGERKFHFFNDFSMKFKKKRTQNTQKDRMHGSFLNLFLKFKFILKNSVNSVFPRSLQKSLSVILHRRPEILLISAVRLLRGTHGR